jgi:integrase
VRWTRVTHRGLWEQKGDAGFALIGGNRRKSWRDSAAGDQSRGRIILATKSVTPRLFLGFRGAPRGAGVPPALLDALDLVHGICELHVRRGKGRGIRLWPWSRMTGWRAVHAVMDATGLDGPHASPKGLRHGFGVAADSAGIPLNLVQKWLGHAQLTTTAIYADATGAEEKDIARRMWE